jgi:hypothetical protein
MSTTFAAFVPTGVTLAYCCVINKVLSKKVLAKRITYPGAAYLSTKKNRNVKEPLVSSHTISYCCVRLRHFCSHQQVSQTAWLFEGSHGRVRKDFGQF